jgi:hypothetical protein
LPPLLNASDDDDDDDDDSLYQYCPIHGNNLTASRGLGKRMCLTNFNEKHFCSLLSTHWLNKFLTCQQQHCHGCHLKDYDTNET